MFSVEQPKFRLIWCDSGMKEQEWIRFLFDDLIAEEVFSETIPSPAAGDVYIVNTNKISLKTLSDTLNEKIEGNRPVGLIHLSDEWFGGGYDVYRYFDFVIRTHHAAIFEKNPGIFVIPLGWPGKTTGDAAIAKSSERRNRWSFMGNLIATRHEMVKSFSSWRPNACHVFGAKGNASRRLPKAEFDSLLASSTFCPAPMGNVMAETWRFYEALLAGSIPIVERRLTIDYYRNLFGNHPIPTFRNWRQALKFAQRSMKDPSVIDSLQAQVLDWWKNYEQELSCRFRSFVVSGARGEYRNNLSLWRFPSGVLSRLWQAMELTRHHSTKAMIRRVVVFAKRRYKLIARLP